MDHSEDGALSETPFDTFIRQFLHSKNNQRLSRCSREIYQRDTQTLVEYFAERGLSEWSAVTPDHVAGLLDRVIESDRGQRARAARLLSISRLVFVYAVERSLIAEADNPLHRIPPIRVELGELRPDYPRSTLASLERIPADTPEHLRDRSLLRVMYLTGIWMGGVVAINLFTPALPPLCTIFPEGLVRYRSKGGSVEHTLVDRVTMEWLDRWIEVRHRLLIDSREPALWITRQGGRILRSTIASRIRKHAALTRVNPLTEHLDSSSLLP
ncbi:site-specific integrase [Endothiovibrio diazotrophicus]